MKIEKVCVVGMGYIGLPTAALIASKKIPVIGYDINPDIVSSINKGKTHISEPKLDSLVKEAVKSNFLAASNMPPEANIYIIAVPTPFKSIRKKSPVPDISYIESSIKNISRVLPNKCLIILESTSPVGTTKKIENLLKKLRPDIEFNLAYCPERVLPGKILSELVSNDRVIGGVDEKSSRKAKSFYKNFVEGKCYLTNSQTAEMVKLTENSFRDVEIAFANELSMICENEDINVWELIKLANKHPRVDILQPGPGVGGHCIAVDPWFIIDKNPQQSKLIKQARQVNDSKPDFVLKKILEQIKTLKKEKKLNEKDVKISFFGITFKPNIDDIRESPALYIVNKALEMTKCKISVVEPNLKGKQKLNNLSFVSLSSAKRSSHIVVILVDHKEFSKLQFKKGTIIIDTKGIVSN